jgi:hypothetical protein
MIHRKKRRFTEQELRVSRRNVSLDLTPSRTLLIQDAVSIQSNALPTSTPLILTQATAACGIFPRSWSTLIGGTAASLEALPELNWAGAAAALYRPSASSPTLRLPPHSLLPGSSYTFVLTATTAPSPSASPAATAPVRVSTAVTVAVALAPLAVAVRGGERTVPNATRIVVVADASDPSASAAPSGKPYPFIYRWAVLPLNTSYVLSAAVLAALTARPDNTTEYGRELALPAGALVPGEYRVSVAVSKAPLGPGRVEVCFTLARSLYPSIQGLSR